MFERDINDLEVRTLLSGSTTIGRPLSPFDRKPAESTQPIGRRC